MNKRASFAGCSGGSFAASLVSVFLVVLFIAMLFGTRVLNRPDKASAGERPRYSDRYHELVNRGSLSEAEQAELELETCRYQHDAIRFLSGKPLANRDVEIAKYQQACEKILPLERK